MACYGNEWIKTPNLNSLSEQSFIMERAYVGQPVCTPARGTITTGLHPHNAGPTVNVIPLPPEQKTIAEESKNKADNSNVFLNPIVTEITKLDKFWPAEDYHNNYYVNNMDQPYCRVIIKPKLDKLFK